MTWNGTVGISAICTRRSKPSPSSIIYDENSMRIEKSAASILDGNKGICGATSYTYSGSNLTSEICRNLIGSETVALLYSYDADGTLVSVNYNGTEYYYLRNS